MHGRRTFGEFLELPTHVQRTFDDLQTSSDEFQTSSDNWSKVLRRIPNELPTNYQESPTIPQHNSTNAFEFPTNFARHPHDFLRISMNFDDCPTDKGLPCACEGCRHLSPKVIPESPNRKLATMEGENNAYLWPSYVEIGRQLCQQSLI